MVVQVNRPQPKAELESLQTSVQRGRPFGSTIWQAMTAKETRTRIHLSASRKAKEGPIIGLIPFFPFFPLFRSRGRPRKDR